MVNSLKQIKYTVVVEALKGEVACGDKYLVKESNDFTLIAVIDGLGHGEDAAIAADVAVKTIDANASESIDKIIKICDEALLLTRGAAITIVKFHKYKMTYKAIGNVSGVYWHIGERAKLKSQSFFLENGIVGNQLPLLLPIKEIELGVGDTLILATDGIRKEFENLIPKWSSVDRIANEIFSTYQNPKDDGLILVAQLL
ncbi:MAG: SpoIIE family protein phosphatase [Tatlockia sp.]|nr:SpoIIE family protein phosphatase [Tatlockia sp.]